MDNSAREFRDYLTFAISCARCVPDALDPTAASILDNVRKKFDACFPAPDAAVSSQSEGDPDGWLAVKVNGEGGIVMPYGPLHAGPDRPTDPRYRWAPFHLGEPA